MDLVTIITPIYNGEKYLKRYFAQINAIGYKDLQILVVNDGSKDKTSEIVQKYAEEDSRIEFIDKKVNEGVSSARNDALKRAKGVFCFFFDCDDTFDAQIIEKCVAIASVASELITNMVQFVYMKKKVKFKLNMKPLVQSIITVAAMAVCVWKVGTLNFSNTVLLALEVIVGSVVYVVLNILMKNQLMLEVINMTKQRIHNATKKRI